jgi:hypothetical protein
MCAWRTARGLYTTSAVPLPQATGIKAQFWYTHQLFLAGKGEETQKIFLKLRQLQQLPFTQKRSPRGIVMHQDRTRVVFYGQIYCHKPTFKRS